MDEELERYINDHLAGASGAMLVIQRLAETHTNTRATDFFIELKREVDEDRDRLKQLLVTDGARPSGVLKTAGKITARLGLAKFNWEGFESGELGMFEALEMLALGVQGKRLLWRTLHEIASWHPEWSQFDFTELEREAVCQRDGVERWRLAAARETFVTTTRDPAVTPH